MVLKSKVVDSLLRAGPLLLMSGLLAGCSTTTRSVTESPRDPALQSSPQQQRSVAKPLNAKQLNSLSLAEVETLLIRDRTTTTEVVRIFGQPDGMTQSGNQVFWNYTHQFRDQSLQLAGLKSLTVLFNPQGVVADYDFQDNTYRIE